MNGVWNAEKAAYEIEFSATELGIINYALIMTHLETKDPSVAELQNQLNNMLADTSIVH